MNKFAERLRSYNERQPDHVLWRIRILADGFEAAAEIDRLTARVEELERALKPFADKANELEEYAAQGDEKPSDYTAGASYEECRAARTTLEASDRNGETK